MGVTLGCWLSGWWSYQVKLEMVSGLCLRMRKEVGRRLKAVKDVDDEKKKWTKRVGRRH